MKNIHTVVSRVFSKTHISNHTSDTISTNSSKFPQNHINSSNLIS